MLTDMASKAKEEKNEEEVEFAKFSTWCKMESEKEGELIESLTNEIAALESKASELKKEVEKLNEDVTKFDAQIEKETAERKKDHEAFVEEEKDYSESVDALGRAIAVVSQNKDVPGGASAALAQLNE